MPRPVLVFVLVLVFVFVLVSVPACRRPAPPPPPLPPTTQKLLRVAEDLGDPAIPAANPRARLHGIALATRVGLVRRPDAPAAALSAAIFEAGGFVREVDDKDLRYVLLPSVLAARRGSCVGLGSLLLAVAPLAGVQARGVLVPGHFYVQVREGERWRNVELLRRGQEMPNEWYRTKYGAPEGEVAGRPLSDDEVAGVVAYDVGNERRRQGRLADARRAYERAVRDFPTYAQAHASLGTTLQLLGELDAARAAYAAARRLDPALPGLERNVELLDQERVTRAGAAAGTAAP